MGGCFGKKVKGLPDTRQEGARRALLTIFCLYGLNFVDRLIPTAILSEIQQGINADDFTITLPGVIATIVYMTLTTAFGSLSDREIGDRRVLLCGAAIFWSVATLFHTI